MSAKIVLFLLAAAFLAALPGYAEKVDGPGEVERNSTHIITATVLNIYSKPTVSDTFETTNGIAEVRIEEMHKGDGLKPGQLIYARYWRHTKWIGKGVPAPGPMGHANVPKEREKVKIGLVKNTDGSFDVYYVGGFMQSDGNKAGSR